MKKALRHFGILLLFGAGSACRQQEPQPVTGGPAAIAPATAGAQSVEPIDRAMPRPDVIAMSPPLEGFKRGINLGNCLDAPSEGEWGTRISQKHFEMAAAAGLDHVRLPVRFTAAGRSAPTPPFAIEESFFARVDWAIDQALARRLSIIVDLHHFEEIHKEPRAHEQRLYALWRQIATRYASRPPQVAFEILNEPNGALTPEILNQFTAEALRIIRETNPTRIVFANSYFWANAERLGELVLPASDPNVVAQFHMYQPFLFTHQGAPWVEPWAQTRGVIFPGPPKTPLVPVETANQVPWVKEWFQAYNEQPAAQNPGGARTVFEHFDHAARYVKATGKRVYLGEFGAIDIADPQSRENYLWLVRTEAERRGIGWA
ncbi:MAG TPA: cellulase family glycosylhydrolase, partial [Polyangiaceae bacterium]